MAKKILILEDESELRFIIREHLESPDLEIIEAASVKEAFTLIQNEAPHLVILDIYLGHELGLDLAVQIADSDLLYRKPKVLVISGTVGGELLRSEELRTQHQVHEFLRKPFSLADLKHHVEQLLAAP